MELEQVINECHRAWNDFAQGNSAPIKTLFSHGDDVTLANPFGPGVRGWKRVEETLDYASSRMRDGIARQFDSVSLYVSPDLATHFEVEHWIVKIGGRPDVTPFVLRVSTTYRREDGEWKIVHRHADPITTFDPDGPIRSKLS